MDLVSQLEKIESSGLIRVAQRDPELAYIFRHALVQDAAYESLLRADRRSLHAAVGATLENLYAGRLDEIAGTLAMHFERAEERGKAIRYLVRAGESATCVYALNEAIEFFRHALELIPESYPQSDLIHLYNQYGHVLELAGCFDDAIKLYDQMRTEALRHQNPQMELLALLARAIIHSTPSPLQDTDLAQELSARALTLAVQLGDREAESRTYWILMLALLFDGQVDDAVVYGEKALEIASQINNPERLAFTLNDLAHCYSTAGQRQKAYTVNLEARQLWKTLGNTHMLVDNLNTCAENLFMLGKLDEADPIVTEGYTTACSIQNVWAQVYSLMIISLISLARGDISRVIEASDAFFALDPPQSYMLTQIILRSTLGCLYLDLGQPEKAFQVVRKDYQIPAGLKPTLHCPMLACQARLELRLGNLVEAEKLLDQALVYYNPENFLAFSPFYVALAQYEIYIAQGQHLKALASLDQYIEQLDRKEIFCSLPEHLLYKAQVLLTLNRKEEALTLLKEITSSWAHLNFHQIMWKVYALMSTLQLAFGQSAEAKTSRQIAREHFDFLLTNTPADLRPSILALPDAKILLEGH
jgi:tetratricopeptide (TPR) repeat protein